MENLECCFKDLQQGELTIAQYFLELGIVWQELNYYQDFQARYVEDATTIQKVVDKEGYLISLLD